MLFASDLDRTLIYSSNFTENLKFNRIIFPVEIFQGNPFSYMTQEALALLKQLSEDLLFIPVTTRTKLQYERINWLQYGINPKYAVTSNGGRVFIEGQEDEDWKSLMRESCKACSPVDDILQEFSRIRHNVWVKEESGKIADDLFYYCIVERDKIPMDEVNSFRELILQNGWRMSIQGRKLYLVPQYVDKQKAVAYIKARESGMDLVAAGDSLLDLNMLMSADLALAPSDGELYSAFTEGSLDLSFVHFTKTTGLTSVEEILTMVSEYKKTDNQQSVGF